MIETMQAFLDAVPFARWCGMRVVAADRDAQTLALEMPFADHLGNAETTRQFHGGAIANLIDTAATFAAALATGGTPATVARLGTSTVSRSSGSKGAAQPASQANASRQKSLSARTG